MKELLRIDLRKEYKEWFSQFGYLSAQHRFCPTQYGLMMNFDGKLILVSRNRGKTWHLPAKFDFNIVLPPTDRGIFVHPKNDDVQMGIQHGWEFYRSSTGGITWAGPFPIPTAEKHFSACTKAHTFSAICTRGGYIVVASSYCLGVLEAEAEVLCTTISDDWGATWKVGQLFWPPGNLPKAPEGFSEPAVVDLGGSSLWLVFRSVYGELWQSFSEDMGMTWAPATSTGLASPLSNCYAISSPGGAVVLVWNLCKPGMETDFRKSKGSLFRPRTNLVFAISRDHCRTWTMPVTVEKQQGQYPTVHFDEDRMFILYQSYPSDDIARWEEMGLTLVAYDMKEVDALKPWTRKTMQPLVEEGLVAPWLALHVDKPLWEVTD